MTEPRWYCLSREGMATLCIDKADAEMTAINADELYRRAGPHRAVQLVEAAPQPQQAAPVAVPMCSEQAVLHALTMARSETHKQGDAALWQAFGRAMWRQFNAMLAASQPPASEPAAQQAAHIQSVTCPDHRCQFMGECYAPADCKSGAPATQPAEPSEVRDAERWRKIDQKLNDGEWILRRVEIIDSAGRADELVIDDHISSIDAAIQAQQAKGGQ